MHESWPKMTQRNTKDSLNPAKLAVRLFQNFGLTTAAAEV